MEFLGPSGRVPEEFLDFGPVAAGQGVHLRCLVAAERPVASCLAVGAAATKRAWLDGRPVALDGAGYLATGAVELPARPVVLDLRLTATEDVAALRAHFAFVDDVEGYARPEWLRPADGCREELGRRVHQAGLAARRSDQRRRARRRQRAVPRARRRPRGGSSGRLRPVRGVGSRPAPALRLARGAPSGRAGAPARAALAGPHPSRGAARRASSARTPETSRCARTRAGASRSTAPRPRSTSASTSVATRPPTTYGGDRTHSRRATGSSQGAGRRARA